MTFETDELNRLIAVQLGCKQVRLEDRLVEDLDISSVDLVNLVVAVEDRFRLVIPEEDAATLRTVADLHALATRLSDS